MNDVRRQLLDLIVHLLPEDLANESQSADDAPTDGPHLKQLFAEAIVEAICTQFTVSPQSNLESASEDSNVTVVEEMADGESNVAPKPSCFRYTYDSMGRLIRRERE